MKGWTDFRATPAKNIWVNWRVLGLNLNFFYLFLPAPAGCCRRATWRIQPSIVRKCHTSKWVSDGSSHWDVRDPLFASWWHANIESGARHSNRGIELRSLSTFPTSAGSVDKKHRVSSRCYNQGSHQSIREWIYLQLDFGCGSESSESFRTSSIEVAQNLPLSTEWWHQHPVPSTSLPAFLSYYHQVQPMVPV